MEDVKTAVVPFPIDPREVERALLRSRAEILDLFSPDADEDMVAYGINAIRYVDQGVREIKREANDALLVWLERNGDLTVGDVRHYVGKKTIEKCRDQEAALDSAFTVTGGDLARVASLLSVNAFKPGTCEGELGKEWRETHFEKTVKLDPKTGKAKRTVKQVDAKRMIGKKES